MNEDISIHEEIRLQKERCREHLYSLAPIEDDGWGKAAERLRRTPSYRNARTVMVSLGSALHQVRLNALTDRKMLILPTPGLQNGFVLLDPGKIPPQKKNLAIRLDQRNPYPQKIQYGKPMSHPIDLIVTDALAAGRDGSRIGDGKGHLDLQYAILFALGWLAPQASVSAVTDRLLDSVPMEDTDVGAQRIVTATETVETGREDLPTLGVVWDRLAMKTIRRNDGLFFLYRAAHPKEPNS
ncbi:MAG: 5-formyltetrahydrofolate cyclo-ligase [Acidobacteriota bacterium]